jgi:UDP-glucose 4-epimerase
MTPKLTEKSVMVTGGAGFIGSHLVDRIIQEAPSNLVVVDNLFLGKMENLDQARQRFPALKFYSQDVCDYEAMKQLIIAEDVEVVFNLAVVPLPTSLERPRWTVDTNVAMTTVVCELLREGYCQSLIQFSSSEAYGSARYVPMDEKHPLVPSTPYAASKIACDYVVLSYQKTFGIDAAILRPFNNFGPRQNGGAYAGVIPIVIQRALQGSPVVIYGDGEQTRDFVFVRQVADAAVRSYEEPATRGHVINVASGQEVSINRLVREILAILDIDAPIVYEAPRPGDVRRHRGAVGLAQKLIDFQPGTLGLLEGLEETVDWYRRHLLALKGDDTR